MKKIFIVGVGPDGEECMTLSAINALKKSDVVIGYRRYIEKILPLVRGKDVRSYGMREEVDRVADAIAMAENGRIVSVVSGGDASVYGMASPILEVLPSDIDVDIIPGVTAAISAASRLGAPLALDFAVLNLSDILAPWQEIRLRAECFAKSGVTTVLYNPRSKSRKWQLKEIFELFRSIRGDFYVAVVREAFAEHERVVFFRSFRAPDGWMDEVDMLSIVFFCDQRCCQRNGRLFTPRGYKLKGGGARKDGR